MNAAGRAAGRGPVYVVTAAYHSSVTPPAPDPRGARQDRPVGGPKVPGTGTNWPRPVVWVLIGIALLALLAAPAMTRSGSDKIDYSTFLDKVRAGQVAKIDVDNDTSHINGVYTDNKKFTTTAPAKIPD